MGCRLERSRQWATRCLHESALHKSNAFITLTYDASNLPPGASLVYSDFQKFMKRLRKHFTGQLVRFYMCGEYGSQFSRPHFHACIFGVDFLDKSFWQTTPSGAKLYRSPSLERLWPFGFSSVGEVTFESAAYVARYIMKKITGDLADEHYSYTDPSTGEVISRTPEFTHMSLKPGVGSGWFTKYVGDVFPHDYVIARGAKSRPPRYYDKIYQKMAPVEMETIRFERGLTGLVHAADNTPERLLDREIVAKAKSNIFPRPL